jgi:hypothetical protein
VTHKGERGVLVDSLQKQEGRDEGGPSAPGRPAHPSIIGVRPPCVGRDPPDFEKGLASARARSKIGARLGCRSVAQHGLRDRNG